MNEITIFNQLDDMLFDWQRNRMPDDQTRASSNTDPVTTGSLMFPIPFTEFAAQWRRVSILPLFGIWNIPEGNTLFSWYEDTVEGITTSSNQAAEGDLKNQVHPTFGIKKIPLSTDASFLKISNLALYNSGAFANWVVDRFRYVGHTTLEDHIMSGLAASTIPTGADIEAGVANVITNGGKYPTGMILHPTDYVALRKLEGVNFQQQRPQVDGEEIAIYYEGIRVYITPAINQGTGFVANFDLGFRIAERGPVSLALSDSDADDFQKNLISLRLDWHGELLILNTNQGSFFTVS